MQGSLSLGSMMHCLTSRPQLTQRRPGRKSSVKSALQLSPFMLLPWPSHHLHEAHTVYSHVTELSIDNCVLTAECEEWEYTTCNTHTDGQSPFSEPAMFQERPELSNTVNLWASLPQYNFQKCLLVYDLCGYGKVIIYVFNVFCCFVEPNKINPAFTCGQKTTNILSM